MKLSVGIDRELLAQGGLRACAEPERRVGGGGGNQCYAWRCGADLIFVKVTVRAALPTLTAEAQGLEQLRRAGAFKVPRVLACGSTEIAAFLALEWIETQAADERSAARCGAGLAALHQITAPRFGFGQDNYLGGSRQRNDWAADWAEFFREQRLRPQLELAAGNGAADPLASVGPALLEAVPALLAGHRPAASLLHGDLWGGNWLTAAGGEAVLIDPAVYYGDREADLAMTRLFGGFGPAFYRAYELAAPLPAGAAERGELYNLYHLLNHAHLFGGGYAQQARSVIDRLLARAGV